MILLARALHLERLAWDGWVFIFAWIFNSSLNTWPPWHLKFSHLGHKRHCLAFCFRIPTKGHANILSWLERAYLSSLSVINLHWVFICVFIFKLKVPIPLKQAGTVGRTGSLIAALEFWPFYFILIFRWWFLHGMIKSPLLLLSTIMLKDSNFQVLFKDGYLIKDLILELVVLLLDLLPWGVNTILRR